MSDPARHPNGWRCHVDEQTPRHVWPVNDLKPHVLNGKRCWCGATEKDGVVVHHSMDRREEYEVGRKVS